MLSLAKAVGGNATLRNNMMALSKLIVLLMVIHASINLCYAQFPAVCMDTMSLKNRICCPNYEGSTCGSNDGRGECKDILSSASSPTGTVRDNWPYYFDKVCICAKNYAGYDCSRCKYGYHGEKCDEKTIMMRKSIQDLSMDEWNTYLSVLENAKKHDSGYKVFLQEPRNNHASDQMANIKLYELFVWQHHYAAKDSENSDPTDYAHESSGFPTWHRQFLLWFEWELQYLLKESGEKDYYKFRIPLWDWRKERQTKSSYKSPFQTNRLGATVNMRGQPQVQGGIFDDWETVCWRKDQANYNRICDPTISTGQLQRCPLSQGSEYENFNTECTSNNSFWPTASNIEEALKMEKYDTHPFSRKSNNSFRNMLEGFQPLPEQDAEKCTQNPLCSCESDTDGLKLCIQRSIHNSVHIVLGIGYFGSMASKDKSKSGVMADVAASANDPIFISHHAMVDCIFEKWLKKYRNPQYPTSSEIPQGHRKQDYIVPFFPLYTHEDMFLSAENFGYRCDLNDSDKTKRNVLITIFVIGSLVVGFIFVLCCCCKCIKCEQKPVNDSEGEGDNLISANTTTQL